MRVARDKASGPDKISNRILKAAEKWLVSWLVTIFNASVRLEYHPKAWKAAVTLVLQKLNKDNYTDLKTYCLITLLNTMEKLLESIIIQKILQLVKIHSLLLKSQMSAHKEHLTKTALQLLTE